VTFIAICIPKFKTHTCRASVAALVEEFKRREIRGVTIEVADAAPLEQARAQLLWRARKTEFTHQFCLDGDVAFTPPAFFELLDADKPLVCGAYPSRNPDDKRFIVAAKTEPITRSIVLREPKNMKGPRLIEIAWGNLGFALVKREALNRMILGTPNLEYETTPRDGDPTVLHALYQTFTAARRYHSEDVAFYRRAEIVGIQAHCAIDCEIEHDGVHGRLGDLFP
jgi:hypothetical protein